MLVKIFKNKKWLGVALGGLAVLSLVGVAYGAGITVEPGDVNPNIPGSSPATQAGPNPVGLIGNFYEFALMMGGLLAFVIIIFAAIRYTVSADNPSKQGDAKDQIRQALLGLLLLAGAFLVLNTINPKLTNLEPPELKDIERTQVGFGSDLLIVKLCDSTKATDRQGDALIPCGVVYPISDSEACLGVRCDRPAFGDFRYCNLTDLKSFSVNESPTWSKGTCVTEPMQGININDPSKIYSVTPNGLLERDCGYLDRDTPSKLIVGTGNCPNELSCVSYDSPPIDVDIGALSIAGEAENFECR